VVVIYGMGEHISMETLRGFVEAAWVKDSDVHWLSPPDERPEDIWCLDAGRGQCRVVIIQDARHTPRPMISSRSSRTLIAR
jgi:hypothetical protein